MSKPLNRECDLQRIRDEFQIACEAEHTSSLQQIAINFLNEKPRPSDFSFAAAQLRKIGADGARFRGLRQFRVFIARSVTIEPILPYVMVHAAARGMWLQMEVGGYGSFIEELIEPESALARFDPELILFLCDLEDVAGDIQDLCFLGREAAEGEIEKLKRRLQQLVEGCRINNAGRILVQGFSIPSEAQLGAISDSRVALGQVSIIQELNTFLKQICRVTRDCIFFDQDQIAAAVGRNQWRDQRMFRTARECQ